MHAYPALLRAAILVNCLLSAGNGRCGISMPMVFLSVGVLIGLGALLGLVVGALAGLARNASVAGLLLIALSLLVVRPVAIRISRIGTDCRPNERLFSGWFGPAGWPPPFLRVFVIMGFEQLEMGNPLLVTAIMAVLISAFVHDIAAQYACEIFRLEGKDEDS